MSPAPGTVIGAAQRQVMGETLVELGRQHPDVLVVDGDVGNSTGAHLFEDAHPERYVQAGIAEQNMVAMAAGLATVGFRPYVTSFACFAVARALDSVRVLVAQPSLDVTILGGYAGLLTGRTGKTHQMFNDVAVMRSMPHVTVLAPADEHELRAALHAVHERQGQPGPVYVQVCREPSPTLFEPGHRFQIGRGVVLREGADVTLVSTGVQTTRVTEAAELLAAQGTDAAVLHLPTIAPVDEQAVVEAAERSGVVVTVEEQDVHGGLGGTVAEVLGARRPTPVHRLGLTGYGESGSNEDLLDKYGLSARRVADRVEQILRAG